MGRLQFPTDLKYIKKLLEDAKIAEEDVKQLSQEFYLWMGHAAKKVKFKPLKVKDLGKTVQPGSALNLSFKSDTSLERVIKELKTTLKNMQEEEQRERSQIEDLENQIRKKQEKILKLEHDLEIEKQAKKIAKKIDFQVDNPMENNQYINEITEVKGKIKLLQESISVLGKLEKKESSIQELDLHKIDNLFPLDLIGIDIRSGTIIGDKNSKLLLEELNSTERELFFLMQNKPNMSKTKIWDLIPGKGKRTLKPALRKLEKLGLVKCVKKGKIMLYKTLRLEKLFNFENKS